MGRTAYMTDVEREARDNKIVDLYKQGVSVQSITCRLGVGIAHTNKVIRERLSIKRKAGRPCVR